jgi:hypothetical protein
MRGELAQRLAELRRGFVVRAPAVIDRGLRKDGGRDVVVFRVFQAPALATHLGGEVGDARVTRRRSRRVTRSACAFSCARRFSITVLSRSARAMSAFAAAWSAAARTFSYTWRR